MKTNHRDETKSNSPITNMKTFAPIVILFVGVIILECLATPAACNAATSCNKCINTPGCGWFSPSADDDKWRCVTGTEFTCDEPVCTTDQYFYTSKHCPDDSLETFIRGRRTIRQYLPHRLSHSALSKLLTLGTWAPTAVHREPWRFVVVQNQTLLHEIAMSINPTSPDGIFYKAPAAIFIFTENAYPGFDEIDTGLAIMNLELSAFRVGLGTTTIGFTRMAPEGFIADELGVPSTWSFRIAVAIGHPQIAPTSTRNPPVIHWFD